ncbi:MAG: hypothetical protein ACETVY_02600 [Candidatus Bathyarchaeia archaeon]
MRCVLQVQDEILSALRDFLRSNGFVEILAPHHRAGHRPPHKGGQAGIR